MRNIQTQSEERKFQEDALYKLTEGLNSTGLVRPENITGKIDK